jgi:NADH-quinone oxidoreductase subunit L
VPVQLWPVGNTVPIADYLGADLAKWLNTPRYVNAATLVGLALFLGCAGKSAQIPLYVWLPDAMAGPTPVSALIHAATMVTAGVYLVCRMAGVFVLSPAAMLTVALVGAVTAVLAATIAFVQNDIKKVLAYSTVSQLGYMFLGVGVGAFAAGFFHVITHAFFKACLFLGAGSVIHALHARIHDTDASQDMRNMGGLRRYLPYTFWTFVAAWAAIVGLPLTSGFFSKDEILFRAFTSTVKSPVEGGVLRGDEAQIQLFQWPSWAPQLLYALGLAGAIMTAFYMTRLTVGIFAGEFRGWTVVKRWKDSAPEHHQHPADSGHLEGPIPQESPWQMTAPLVVLGGLSIVGGLLNAHAFFHYAPLDHWLEPVFASAATGIAAVSSAEHYEETLLALAFGAFVVGVGGAYWAYMMHAGRPARALAERMPGLHRLVYDKWRIDELYEATVLGAVDSLAEAAVWFDKWVVDFFVARVTSAVVAFSGYVLRQLQTGRVQAYATIMVLGLGGVGWYLTTPHASAATSSDDGAGHYSISASAGLGYHYRWDVDGDGNWDSEDFGDQASASLNLKVDEKRQVRLAVKNAFGRVSVRGIDLYRPKPDLSAAPAPAELERAVRAIQGARGDPQGARGGPPGGVLPLGTARAGVPGAQPGAQP